MTCPTRWSCTAATPTAVDPRHGGGQAQTCITTPAPASRWAWRRSSVSARRPMPVQRVQRRRVGPERQQLRGAVQRVDHARQIPRRAPPARRPRRAPHEHGRDDERDGQRDPEGRRGPGHDEPHGDRAEHRGPRPRPSPGGRCAGRGPPWRRRRRRRGRAGRRCATRPALPGRGARGSRRARGAIARARAARRHVRRGAPRSAGALGGRPGPRRGPGCPTSAPRPGRSAARPRT